VSVESFVVGASRAFRRELRLSARFDSATAAVAIPFSSSRVLKKSIKNLA